MRAILINEILDLAGDEFGREELIELAKEKDYQLRIRLIHIKKMTQHEINQINNYESK